MPVRITHLRVWNSLVSKPWGMNAKNWFLQALFISLKQMKGQHKSECDVLKSEFLGLVQDCIDTDGRMAIRGYIWIFLQPIALIIGHHTFWMSQTFFAVVNHLTTFARCEKMVIVCTENSPPSSMLNHIHYVFSFCAVDTHQIEVKRNVKFVNPSFLMGPMSKMCTWITRIFILMFLKMSKTSMK